MSIIINPYRFTSPWVPTDISGCVLWLDTENPGGRHYITANGDAKITTGVNDPFGDSNGVGTFDGSGDYLSSVDSDDWQNIKTVEGWFRFASLSVENTLFGQGQPTNERAWLLKRENGYLRFFYSTDGTGWTDAQVFNYSWTPTLNQWYHLAATIDGASSKLWVDGNNVSTDTIGSINNASAIMTIAGYWNPIIQEFDGQISNVRYSDSIRYTANFTPPTEAFTTDSNTVFLAPMTGNNNSTVFVDEAKPDDTGNQYSYNDSSGNYSHIRESTNPPTSQFDEINSLSVIRGDGTNDKLANAIGLSQPCTIFIVAKVTASTSDNPLFGDSNLWVGLDDSEYANAYAGSDVNDSTDHSASFKLFTYKIDGASSVLYVNGAQVATGDVGAGDIAAMNLFYEGTNYTAGDIGDVIGCNSALSDGDRGDAETYLNEKFSIY